MPRRLRQDINGNSIPAQAAADIARRRAAAVVPTLTPDEFRRQMEEIAGDDFREISRNIQGMMGVNAQLRDSLTPGPYVVQNFESDTVAGAEAEDLFGDSIVPPAQISRNAVLSPCNRYRYRLSRQWTGDGVRIMQPLTASPAMLFIMLNPSTADAMVDDPTIRRCMAFAKREGCKRMEVVNLFAWRATDPQALAMERVNGWDVVGDENPDAILDAIECTEVVVVAWGDNVSRLELGMERAGEIVEMLAALGRDIYCLGVTQNGNPRHPLYVKGDAPLTKFQTAFSEVE